MKMKDLTVDIKAQIVVDKETAEKALKLVEWYVNENGRDVVVHVKDNGEKHYEFW